MPRLTRTLVAALISGALVHPLAAAEWDVVEADSHLAFHGSMLGVPAVGYFRRFESRITFDPDDLENARVTIEIDMASVDSAHDERDTALKLPEWFAAGAFPKAFFEAAEFRNTGGAGQDNGANYEMLGSLTIKGISKDIAVPFTLAIADGTATVSGQLDLNRSDFNIGTGEWATDRLVAFDVQVEFRIVARRLVLR